MIKKEGQTMTYQILRYINQLAM